MQKIPVGILGATGTVGQKFILLLEGHPWFEITCLAASERSAGRSYAEVVNWKQSQPIPERVRDLPVQLCEPNLECRIAFSGLDSSVAGEVEEAFARRGYWVFSNARNHRMAPDVPLLIAELNAEHLQAVEAQRRRRGWRGAIVTNPNCSTIILALSLGPLHREFGLREVQVVTLQAVSGAGYPGLPSLDILSNVIPHIGGEEEKVETETRKILGSWDGKDFQWSDFRVSAHCNRVPVPDGHMACVSVRLAKPAEQEDILRSWQEFRSLPQQLELPSAPRNPVVWLSQRDRPQPQLDVQCGGGMSVTVGRLRPCPVLQWKYVALGHNTIRGAAGASILNAELACRQGLLS